MRLVRTKSQVSRRLPQRCYNSRPPTGLFGLAHREERPWSVARPGRPFAAFRPSPLIRSHFLCTATPPVAASTSDAKSASQELTTPPPSTPADSTRPISGIIISCLKARKIQAAIRVIRDPLHANREIDVKAWNLFLSNLAKLPPHSPTLGPFASEGVSAIAEAAVIEMRRRGQHPDAYTYSALLKWCLDFSHLRRFDYLWRQMKTVDKVTPDNVLNLLKEHRDKREAEMAKKLADTAVAETKLKEPHRAVTTPQPTENSKKKPRFQTLNLSAVVVAHLKARNIAGALDQLRAHKRKAVDIQAYSILLREVTNVADSEAGARLGAYASDGVAGVVDTVLADMLMRRVTGNQYTYATLMKYYLDTNQTTKFDKAWAEMKDNNVVPDTVNFNFLLRRQSLPGMAYGSFEEANDMISQLSIRPNDETLAQLLRIQARTGRAENGVSLLQELVKTDVQITPNLLSAIVEVICRQYGEEVALNALSVLADKINPTLDAFHTILISLIRRASVLGYGSFSSTPQPSSTLDSASWSDLAAEYGDQVKNIPPGDAGVPVPLFDYDYQDSPEYTVALESSWKKLTMDLDEILFKTFAEMQKLALVPSHKTFLHILAIHSQLRDSKRFTETLQLMQSTFGPMRTRPEFDAVVHFYSHASLTPEARWQHIDDLFAQMRRAGITPDSRMYATLISRAIYEGDVEKAKGWLQQLKADGLTYDLKTLRPLLVPLAKRGLVDQYFKVIDHFKQTELGHDLGKYRPIQHETVRVYCNAGMPNKALACLEEYGSNGFDPDILTFNLVLDAYVRKKDFAKARKVLALAQRNNLAPNSKTLAMAALIPKGPPTQ